MRFDCGCPSACSHQGHGGGQATSGTGHPDSGPNRALPTVYSGGDQYQLGEADSQEYARQPAIQQQRPQHGCEEPFKAPIFTLITGRALMLGLPVRGVIGLNYFGDKYLQLVLRFAKCLLKVSAFMGKALWIYGKMWGNNRNPLNLGFGISDFGYIERLFSNFYKDYQAKRLEAANSGCGHTRGDYGLAGIAGAQIKTRHSSIVQSNIPNPKSQIQNAFFKVGSILVSDRGEWPHLYRCRCMSAVDPRSGRNGG